MAVPPLPTIVLFQLVTARRRRLIKTDLVFFAFHLPFGFRIYSQLLSIQKLIVVQYIKAILNILFQGAKLILPALSGYFRTWRFLTRKRKCRKQKECHGLCAYRQTDRDNINSAFWFAETQKERTTLNGRGESIAWCKPHRRVTESVILNSLSE